MYYATHAIRYVYKSIYARKLISVIDTGLGIYPYKTIWRTKDKSSTNFLRDPVSTNSPWVSLRSILVVLIILKNGLKTWWNRGASAVKFAEEALTTEKIERLPGYKNSWQQLENGINAACTL